eukprot:903461-Pelagomonas_calceolata.AAC.1
MNRGRSPGLTGYKFRATCLSDDELMCPRPLPDAGPCSSNPISGGTVSSGNSSSNSTAEVQGFCRQVGFGIAEVVGVAGVELQRWLELQRCRTSVGRLWDVTSNLECDFMLGCPGASVKGWPILEVLDVWQ